MPTSTKNSLKSFFQKLKQCVPVKLNLKSFLSRFLALVSALRTQRRHESITVLSKVSTEPLTSETEHKFHSLLIPRAFAKVKQQMNSSLQVDVIDQHTVNCSSGVLELSSDRCTCSFYCSVKLPCRHILALRRYKQEDIYIVD